MPLKLDNEPELREAQAALFNINSTGGWILLNYVGPQTVHFAAGGEGEPDEVSPHFEDDQIQRYGVIRLGNIVEKGTLKPTVRDVMFTWVGPNVGLIEKGKKTALLGDAQNLLQPYHGDIKVTNKANFNRDTILDRSHPLSGSHEIN